jgi:hypothetical protein
MPLFIRPRLQQRFLLVGCLMTRKLSCQDNRPTCCAKGQISLCESHSEIEMATSDTVSHVSFSLQALQPARTPRFYSESA